MLLIVLSQVLRIPGMTDKSSVGVFDVVGPVMDDLANFVWSFPVWAQDAGLVVRGVETVVEGVSQLLPVGISQYDTGASPPSVRCSVYV